MSSTRVPRQTLASPELTAPAYVVLGMVRLGARSGYEIKQMVEQSIRFFWTISQVQIYPSLKLLEEAGLVTGKDETQGRRRRKLYEVTPAGERALRDWLRGDESMPFELRDIGMVKLFFADVLDRNEALGLLGSVRRRSEERVLSLRAIEATAREAEEHGNVYPLLTLEMGIGFHRAMIEVCEEFEGKFKKKGQSLKSAAKRQDGSQHRGSADINLRSRQSTGS